MEKQNDYGLEKAWNEWQSDLKNRGVVSAKTISIDGNLHEKIKIYCTLKGLNIGDWVQEKLSKSLND